MLSEVINALYLTYIATEYTLLSEDSTKQRGRLPFRRWLSVGAVVGVVNGLDRWSGLLLGLTSILRKYQWTVAPCLVALAYVVCLYWDCHWTLQRVNNNTDTSQLDLRRDFLPRVITAFVRILPVYPLAAVVISFGFLFVINLFEFLHLPVELLNWPIYYGTLYGPFSYIYMVVKQAVVRESGILPV